MANNSMPEHLPLSRPDIDQDDVSALTEVLKSGRLSIGDRKVQFEKEICERSGCDHALAVSSGTAALLLCLEAMGIGAGDEVITVSFSFVATANVIVHRGANPSNRNDRDSSKRCCCLVISASRKATHDSALWSKPHHRRRCQPGKEEALPNRASPDQPHVSTAKLLKG